MKNAAFRRTLTERMFRPMQLPQILHKKHANIACEMEGTPNLNICDALRETALPCDNASRRGHARRHKYIDVFQPNPLHDTRSHSQP